MKGKLPHLSRAATCITLLVFAIACAKPPNDAKVTSDIQAKLAADSGLQDEQITVQSANGTVTLSGNVDSQAERDAAAKYAASEAGVKTVVNNLQIGPAQATSEPASEPESSTANSKPAPSSRRHKSAPQQNQMAQNDATLPGPAEQSQTATAANQPPSADPATAPVTQSAPPPPPEPAAVTVPSGAALSVRLNDAIDSATAQAGDKFRATLDSPLSVDGNVVVPAHYTVQGHVVNAQSSGKYRGQALLVLQLDRIKVGEKSYNIQTDRYSQQTGARGKDTAEKVGIGAAAGAILGGIFGGGKGAAIGSAAGAGAGGGVQAASKAPNIKLPAEKVLTFTLQSPVTLVPTTMPARAGQKLPSPDSQ
jgi:BON domain-containing protein